MILKEQAAIITTLLNDIAEDENFDVHFYIADIYQEYQAEYTIDANSYVPGILKRLDPFVPKAVTGIMSDFLELELYIPVQHYESIERILNEYQHTYHAISQISGGNVFIQYIGKQVYDEREKSVEGDLQVYQKAYIRIEWDTVISGVPFSSTSLTINSVVYPVKIQTYRNDKATIGNRAYNNVNNINANVVSEELVITIPLTSSTASSALWQDIHTRSFNKTYTIIDNYGAGGIMTKTWELKAGIVNKEENKIVSFTCVFDLPLPRAIVTITHKPLMGSYTTGQIMITSFNAGGANSLDARMRVDPVSNQRLVKANELRQGTSYSLSFIYEPGNEISAILAYRAHKKVEGDRWDITYTFEDLTFTYENLVLESGNHGWADNPGIAFTVNFAEGL